ncbi:MAG: TrbI/VirB10 family protein [Phycisphaerae bacterium]|jgi:hypothetical protein
MNIRKLWTELFQKPAGRLILFLLAGGLIFAFLFWGKGHPSIEAVNPSVPLQATAAKGYSFTEDIPVTPSAHTQAKAPSVTENTAPRPASTPKPPPPIPQAIFATREVVRSESHLPYGRLLRCELVNTVDSTNIETPIIGLVTEEVWHDGRLIIPAGTEVHGIAQQTAARERIGSERKWVLVFQDGRELPLSGTVLDCAPDAAKPGGWSETDGSAGLRGYMIASDKYAEAKAVLAAMISAGAGAFPKTTNLISPLTGGATQIKNGGFTDAISAGVQAGGQIYSQRLLENLKRDPYYVRVPAGTLFYLYVTQTVDLEKATTGLSAANPTNP